MKGASFGSVPAAIAVISLVAACTNQNALVPNQRFAVPQGGVAAPGAILGRVEPPARLHWKRCYANDDYYCGSLRVPLDPAGQVPGKIDIAVALLRHSDAHRPSSGTIVAVEGGPGYPSIGSRGLYRTLFSPLLATRDLLLVDNRGTGASDPVVCHPLQRAPVMRLRDVASCGEQMGATADLFGTALAADDMAAVLAALNIRRADLYGDSYGTFFVQAFAGRHPRSVRTIVLDAAYPVGRANPWYPSTAPQMRDAFDAVCRRSPVCALIPGSSPARLKRLVTALRSAKPTGITPGDLAFVMDSAGLDPLAYRDLDAAARAFLESNDAIPLARLVKEAYTYEEGVSGPARSYSQGLFAAASCSDNPQAYDMYLDRPARAAAWRDALARKRAENPNLYAPFTIDEFLAMPPDYAYVPLCVPWPVPSRLHPPGQPVPPGTRFPDVPTLVLTGDLDTITPPAEGDATARLFSRARHVIVANTGHVSALGDLNGCASSIVRRFTATGKLDAGCSSTIPALHLVPSFARDLDDVVPAVAVAGNRSTQRDLRAVAAATLAAADVLARAYEFYQTAGAGLRGGTFTSATHGNVTHAALSRIAWTNDLFVSGTAQASASSTRASAHLVLQGASNGTIDASWTTVGARAVAIIEGTVDGRVVDATMPAP